TAVTCVATVAETEEECIAKELPAIDRGRAAPDVEMASQPAPRATMESIQLGPEAANESTGAISVERPTRRGKLSPWPDLDGRVPATALMGGSVLRLVDLGRVGLNSDEAVYAGQAASLAGNSHFTSLFPVIRAHPLVFQVLISPLYWHGTSDVAGRYISALF